ncbi:MAG: DUF4244 domain-containing protein [Propionibacteriaceae bacterium]|nr:DUF4244 domain-containing protein [Propionibacteriaceae bacterium]
MWKQIRSDERGMTTAEYAVGTVASVSIVGVIITLIKSGEFRQLLWDLIRSIAESLYGTLPMIPLL